MSELRVGTLSEVTGRQCTVIRAGGAEIGVIQHDGRLYAYDNHCFHQGGPACEGRLQAAVEPVVAPDGDYVEDRLSETAMHFVCPWHGWEYDLRTGTCSADPSLGLRRYEVVCRGDEVFVVV